MHVAILQEYIPTYRVPFFQALRDLTAENGISLEVYAGMANEAQSERRDGAIIDWVKPIEQRQYKLGARRLTIRHYPPELRNADLLIMEQARRNIDVYRLALPRSTWPVSKVALWGHGRDYVVTRSSAEKALTRMLTVRADHFFAYTEGGAHHMNQVGMPRDKITVVRNSTDTQSFAQTLEAIRESDVANFRQEHGLQRNTFLFVGALDQTKRVEFLLESARQCFARDPSFRLLVVGAGPLSQLVLGDSTPHGPVVYLGAQTGLLKAMAFRASLALLVPGRVGLVAVDSIAARVPIITTEWTHHAPEFEYLESGTSVMVAQDSIDAYSDLILNMANDHQRLVAAQLALGALQSFTGVEQMAHNFLDGILRTLRV